MEGATVSRGPGRWQAAILHEVAKGRPVILTEGFTHSEASAIRRAAHTLAKQGAIRVETTLVAPGERVLIARPPRT